MPSVTHSKKNQRRRRGYRRRSCTEVTLGAELLCAFVCISSLLLQWSPAHGINGITVFAPRHRARFKIFKRAEFAAHSPAQPAIMRFARSVVQLDLSVVAQGRDW